MKRILITLLALTLLALSANAQAETVELQLSGAFTVTVPASWEVDRAVGEGYFWSTDNSIIRIRTYSPYYMLDNNLADIEAAMENLAVVGYDVSDFSVDAIEEITLGDYTAFSYSFEQNDAGEVFDRTLLMFQLESGFIVVGHIRPQGAGAINADDLEALKTALPTISQSDVFNFYEGTSIEIPAGWSLTNDSNTGFSLFYAKKDGVELRVTLWPGYGAIAGFEKPLDFLPWVYRGDYDEIEPFDTDKLQEASIAGFDAARYDFEPESLNDQQSYDRTLFTFDIGNNSNFSVMVVSDNPDDDIESIFEVLDTLVAGRRFVCALFADPGIRIRSEPSTSAELVRETFDETLVAFNTVEDDAGNTWFNIGEGYVRSDVIFYEQNPCGDIPEGR